MADSKEINCENTRRRKQLIKKEVIVIRKSSAHIIGVTQGTLKEVRSPRVISLISKQKDSKFHKPKWKYTLKTNTQCEDWKAILWISCATSVIKQWKWNVLCFY